MIAGVKNVLKVLKEAYVLGEANKRWRSNNGHNATKIISDCDQKNVSVGNYTYGDLNIHTFSSDKKVSIGHFCSIADDVVFLLAGNHFLDTISTYPFQKKIINSNAESLSKGDIIIDDDVWIGKGVLILSGVHVGQGSVIAAGAVVAKDIPPYSLAAGVPAKVIKKRFDDETISKLLKINWAECTEECVRKNVDLLYKKIDKKNVDDVIINFPCRTESSRRD